MSQQQLADLQLEMSQLITTDERMLLNFEIRFWRQKAWRAEQQRARAQEMQKEAEALAEKYKDIPQEKLDLVLNEIKEEALTSAKNEAEQRVGAIGLTNFRKLTWDSDAIECIDDKIKFWKNIAENYQNYRVENEEDSDTEADGTK